MAELAAISPSRGTISNSYAVPTPILSLLGKCTRGALPQSLSHIDLHSHELLESCTQACNAPHAHLEKYIGRRAPRQDCQGGGDSSIALLSRRVTHSTLRLVWRRHLANGGLHMAGAISGVPTVSTSALDICHAEEQDRFIALSSCVLVFRRLV